jgi:D-alanyl-D-alanine carboxypeptidase
VRFLRPSLFRSPIIFAAALAVLVPNIAHSEARLVIEVDTGKVLEAENANVPWYPASVTKLMTAYVTLQAVKDGKLTLDTLLTVSPTAASQSPSKMGFRPGTQVTVDNALKMMLVKSANDMAVVLAEGVGGSIDGFSVMMNDTAKRLGMVQTSYVNPNGLPADGQITSARDLAILARSFIKNLPEYEYFVHIPSIRRLQPRGLRHARRAAADRRRARRLLRHHARGARRAAARPRICLQRPGVAQALARHRRPDPADRHLAAQPA